MPGLCGGYCSIKGNHTPGRGIEDSQLISTDRFSSSVIGPTASGAAIASPRRRQHKNYKRKKSISHLQSTATLLRTIISSRDLPLSINGPAVPCARLAHFSYLSFLFAYIRDYRAIRSSPCRRAFVLQLMPGIIPRQLGDRASTRLVCVRLTVILEDGKRSIHPRIDAHRRDCLRLLRTQHFRSQRYNASCPDERVSIGASTVIVCPPCHSSLVQ